MKKFTSAVAAVLAAAGIMVWSPAPAQAATPNCYAHSICAWNSNPPPELGSLVAPNRDVADAPRNTCFADMNGYGPYIEVISNNSNYVWYIFNTSNCTGAHWVISANATEYIPNTFNHAHGWYRTSTTG